VEYFGFARHGATDKQTPNIARRLTSEGEEKTQILCGLLKEQEFDFDCGFVGGQAPRMAQTAEIITRETGMPFADVPELFQDPDDGAIGTAIEEHAYGFGHASLAELYALRDPHMLSCYGGYVGGLLLQQIRHRGIKRPFMVASGMVAQTVARGMLSILGISVPTELFSFVLKESEAFVIKPHEGLILIRNP